MSNENRETWRLDALASNIPDLLANDSVPVRFGEKYGWIALPRELAKQIVADHVAAQRIEQAVEALRDCIPWLEHSYQPTHEGSCTPETPCDMSCVDNAALSELLHRVRAALRPAAGGQE